jgi:TolB-like protein/DNA-binding SARP family transcriptional activator/Tfp pilus assembly protein PilF
MFHLRLFGSPTLEINGAALTGRAVQRHRLGLLALLALAPGRRMSRDKLMAYLWPERDADHGRNLLKQATYVLRAELGETALVSEGDELRLNGQIVLADATGFETAASQGDFQRAIQLYRGPLMDGFFLSDAAEFEEWIGQERQRFANAYANALENLAVAAETSGDWTGAVEWWKKRAAHDPFDTRVALRLMHALDVGGSRASALQHAAIHQRLLQEELGIDAPPKLTAAVERLRRPTSPSSSVAAQQPLAPVRVEPSAPITAPAPAQDSAPALAPLPSLASGRRRWLRFAVAAGALLLLVVVFRAAALRGVDPEPSLVVLPFVNLSGDADNEYFSDGLTEEIISRLSSLESLKVISRTSAMHYKDSQKLLREIAQELNVAHVLEGSVRHVDGRVRITAQLIDAASDNHIWADSFELDLHDSFRVQEQIARAVAGALEVKLGRSAAAQIARRGTEDADALELYRRGRWFWTQRTRESVARAIHYFNRAIARDSGYADAYTGLADAYLVSYQLGFGISEDSAHSRHKWAAERAIALDDASADAHTSAANELWWQGNWPGAERALQRALELNPGNASARGWHALLLFGMRRLEEAHDQARRAYETDPFAIIVSITYAFSHYLLEDYDAAIEQWEKTLELNPDWVPALRQSAVAYSHQGRHAQALEFTARALALTPNSSGTLADAAYVHARAGQAAGTHRGGALASPAAGGRSAGAVRRGRDGPVRRAVPQGGHRRSGRSPAARRAGTRGVPDGAGGPARGDPEVHRGAGQAR